MGIIIPNSRFGRLFIRIDALRCHVVDLDLSSHPIDGRLLEIYEKRERLAHVRRLNTLPEIFRKSHDLKEVGSAASGFEKGQEMR